MMRRAIAIGVMVLAGCNVDLNPDGVGPFDGPPVGDETGGDETGSTGGDETGEPDGEEPVTMEPIASTSECNEMAVELADICREQIGQSLGMFYGNATACTEAFFEDMWSEENYCDEPVSEHCTICHGVLKSSVLETARKLIDDEVAECELNYVQDETMGTFVCFTAD